MEKLEEMVEILESAKDSIKIALLELREEPAFSELYDELANNLAELQEKLDSINWELEKEDLKPWILNN